MQTFREIRERNCYYVDKTAFITRLLDTEQITTSSRARGASATSRWSMT